MFYYVKGTPVISPSYKTTCPGRSDRPYFVRSKWYISNMFVNYNNVSGELNCDVMY